MRADLPHRQITPMPRFASFKLSMLLIAETSSVNMRKKK
jgi:hypothetical protein